MPFLSHLPHEIPFRAASAVRHRDERSVEGVFLCTANDALAAEVMVVEAMAQFAGSLVFERAAVLAAIDRCELLQPLQAGDAVICTVSLDVAFGATYRFSGVGKVNGVEVVRGRFSLALPSEHASS